MDRRRELDRPCLRAITDPQDLNVYEIDFFRHSQRCVATTSIADGGCIAVEALYSEDVSSLLCAMYNNIRSRYVNLHQLLVKACQPKKKKMPVNNIHLPNAEKICWNCFSGNLWSVPQII
jgi:hypothetical protein